MSIDPLDSAMDAEYNPKRNFFGAVGVDVYFCVLVKGQGKVPFDPNQHNQDQRRTSINITIDPLPDSKSIYPIERDMIAESKEWANIVKPSLKALNTDLRAINGKWAQVELVPTGQKYRDKNGEEKERTAVRFLAIYASEAECQSAAAALFGAKQSEPGSTPAPTTTPPTANGAERETAKKFLPALWKSSGQDVTKFAELIASNGLVSKHFSINSPEVLELIQAA